jgi:23S rRNA (guanosine2251-2'-O)-methyltransferase
MIKNIKNSITNQDKKRVPSSNKNYENKDGVLFYGFNQVINIINAKKRKIFEIIGTKDAIARLSAKGVKISQFKVSEVSINHINKSLNLGDVNHQSIVCIASYIKDINIEEEIKSSNFIAVMNKITDVGNIGAMIRSSVALGVNLIITDKFGMPDITNNPAVCKASAGESERAKIAQVASLEKWITKLKENNFIIVSLDGSGDIDIEKLSEKILNNKTNTERKIAIVVGSEGFGIEKKILQQSNYKAKISIQNSTESLNASVALAIGIFELRKILTKNL